MPPPTQLAIATSSINRLLTEESSYGRELATRKHRVALLEQGDATQEDEEGNREFQLRQERRGIEETEAVFEPLREKIKGAVKRAEGILSSGALGDAKEVEAARDAVGRAKGV